MAHTRAVRIVALMVACAAGPPSLAGQVVTGRITAASDSTPLNGVAVTLFDTTRLIADVVRTDSAGQFRLQAPTAGQYRVYIVHSGFAYYVSEEWLRLEHDGELRLDVALEPTTAAQALPAVVIDAERESIRKRRVGGRDLRATEGEIFTRSEIAASAEDAVSLYDLVRTKRIVALRFDRDFCLATNVSGAPRGMRSMFDRFDGSAPVYDGSALAFGASARAFGGTARTQHCLSVLVDEVPWARPGDSEDAYYAVIGHLKPDDIDWMFVERSRGTPVALHIYTKSYLRYANR